MPDISFAPVALLYPLSALSDGCLLIAIALATAMGGRPLLWGACFALTHALYSLLGVLALTEIEAYSETVGDALVFTGSLLLLRHFLHHHFHHQPGGDCGCDNHPQQASLGTMLSTAAGLSLHALASGAIALQIVGDVSLPALITLLLISSLVIGIAVSAAVYIGDAERSILTRFFDRIPGLVAAFLVAVSGWCLLHLVEHLCALPESLEFFCGGAVLVIACVTGYLVYDRPNSKESPHIVTISSRKA